MRVHVVSDVHGRTDALAAAGRGADALICLGDLLLFLDYADYGQGIFADLFGEQATRAYVELRTAKRFDEARALSARLFDAKSGNGNGSGVFEAAIARQYAAMFSALPEPAYLTYGNVDVPRIWDDYLKPGHQVIEGGRGAVSAGGGGGGGEGGAGGDRWAGGKELTFGFAGAGLISPYRTPNEIPPGEFAAKL